MFSAKYMRLSKATVAAMGATTFCWLAAHLRGSDLAVRGRDPSMPTQVPWGAVLLATAAGGAAAYGLVRLAQRTARPRRTFTVAVAAGLVLSSFLPVQAANTTRNALVLLAMHLLAAAFIVPPAARLLWPPQQNRQSQPARTSW